MHVNEVRAVECTRLLRLFDLRLRRGQLENQPSLLKVGLETRVHAERLPVANLADVN